MVLAISSSVILPIFVVWILSNNDGLILSTLDVRGVQHVTQTKVIIEHANSNRFADNKEHAQIELNQKILQAEYANLSKEVHQLKQELNKTNVVS